MAKAVSIALALALAAMLVALLLPQPAYGDPDPGWYSASWQYRQKITIDHDRVGIASDLSSDATSGQKVVVVKDGSLFSANDNVVIKDDNNRETNQVDSVSNDTLTMKYNLAHTYTIAAHGFVKNTTGSINLSYFPALIKITEQDNPIFGKAQGDGDDILFTKDDGVTKLDHEIEYYHDAATKELDAWVKVPTLSVSSDTILYIYYGNSDVANQENVENVWDSNFKMVQHLEETSGTHEDSTSNDNDSTAVTVTTQGSATGQVNGSDALDGADDDITVADAASLDITTNITLEAWVSNLYTAGTTSLGLETSSAAFAEDIKASPAIADVDDDGTLEFVVASKDAAAGLRVFSWNGTTLTEEASYDTGAIEGCHPVIADVDGDGTLEIVVADFTNDALQVFNHNGTTLTLEDSDATAGDDFKSSPAIADVDGDGTLEIIIGSKDGNLYVYNHNGTTLTVEASYTTGAIEACAPAIADVDGDGTLEIVVADKDNDDLYVFNHNGTTLTLEASDGTASDDFKSSPAIADVDGDGTLEIVIGNVDTNLYVYNHNGTTLTLEASYTTGKIDKSVAAIADVDGDGTLEIIIADMDNDDLYVFNHNGTTLTLEASDGTATGDMKSAPAIADVDGDGTLEIVVGSKDDKLYVYNHNGTTLTLEASYTMGDIENAAPAIADVDNDGALEIVIGNMGDDKVYVLSTGSQSTITWDRFQKNLRNTGYLDYPFAIANKEDAYGLMVGTSSVIGIINEKGLSASLSSGWHHVAFTYDGTTQKLYVDGVLGNSQSLSTSINTNANNLMIGDNSKSTLDEVRISDTARSTDWIKTCYNNQSDPSSFYSAGSEEYPAPTVTGITPNKGTTADTALSITDLSGTGFRDGAGVELNYDGADNIAATNVTVVSPTKLTCTFNLSGATAHLGEAWDVKVTNTDAQSGTGDNLFTIYRPDPTVTSITPSTGVNTGTVDITDLAGTNFVDGSTTVKLSKAGADINGTAVTVTGTTKISCTFDLTGAATGNWDVVVTVTGAENTGTLAGGFTVTSPAPTVTGITPNKGTTADTALSITDLAGTNFLDGASVELNYGGANPIAGTSVTVVSPTKLTCTFNLSSVTTHLGDAWDVKVTNPDAQSGTDNNLFTIYRPDPTVASITPSTGVNTGTVDITDLAGTNFVNGSTTVKLSKAGADINGTAVTVTGTTKITCTFDLTGAATGAWDVVVTVTGAENPATLAGGFTVTSPAPTVTGITPNKGTTADTALSITNLAGTNFVTGASVELNYGGANPIAGTSVTVVSSTKLTCTFNLSGATAHLGEAWDVKVTNTDAQSGTGDNLFTIYRPDPTVTSITPSTGVNTGTVDITDLAGTNFVDGSTTVKLSKAGADINGTAVTVTGTTKISCTFDLTGAATGNWDVVVTVTGAENTGTLAGGFTVTSPGVGVASYFKVAGSANMTAGGSNELTITAYDVNHNVATGYTGSKNLTFSGPGNAPDGTVPTVEGTNIGSATPVNFASGVSDAGAATLIAYKAETTAVDVTDDLINSFVDPSYDLDLTVSPGTLDRFTMTGYPASITAGQNFGANDVVITAYDAYNNTNTNYTGQVYFTSSDPQATLPYTEASKYTFTTGAGGDNGVHTFAGTGFTLKTAGPQTITLTGNPSVTSSPITVNPATPHTVTLTAAPINVPADGSSTSTLTATVKDQYGNNVADGTNVTFTTDHGTFASDTTTDQTLGGEARATLTSESSAETVIATVTATANGVSDATAVFFIPEGGAEVEESKTETVCGSDTVLNTPTGGDVSIDATGCHTITVAKYEDIPCGTPTFQVTGDYWDVHLDNVTGVNSLTIEFCPADEDTAIYYCDGSSWRRASGQCYSNGCIVVTITDSTSPGLSHLTGLPFASGTPYPPTPVGGEVYPVNKLAILMPWIALFAAIVVAAETILRRRRAQG